jgi:purine-nucleoside phosphorylase
VTAYGDRVAAAVASAAARAGDPVEIGMILGSGLGAVAAGVEGAVAIPAAEIEGLPASTAPGHAGRLVVGRLAGRRVAAMQGRLHLYEGWAAQEVALPVYLMRGLGATRLVVTNAAGALDPRLAPGEVMLIEDHLNLTGANPLTGPNDDRLGLRFPDMSRAYDPDLRARARAAARAARLTLRRGVYAGIAGPSLETSAERRWLRAAGAHAVGMSTVLEVIAARHAGLAVLGLAAITNAATGGPEQEPDTIEAVLEMAGRAGETIAALLDRLLPEL